MTAATGAPAVSGLPVAAAERRNSAVLLSGTSAAVLKHTAPSLKKLGSPKQHTGSKTAKGAAAATEAAVSQPVAPRRMTVRLMSGSSVLAATNTHTGAMTSSHKLKTGVYRVMIARHRRRASANPHEVLSLLRLASLLEKQCHWNEAADWWERCATAMQRTVPTTTAAPSSVDALKLSQHQPKARLHAVWRRCGWCRFRSWQCCSDNDVRARRELLKQAHTAYTLSIEHVKFDVALVRTLLEYQLLNAYAVHVGCKMHLLYTATFVSLHEDVVYHLRTITTQIFSSLLSQTLMFKYHYHVHAVRLSQLILKGLGTTWCTI
jgi:hypothetical protein